ncbi:hypothetical protein [Chitinophaga rhizophila]|uniref:Uncharacterized protein n=1 Tax=Chitinophaga rhizophila TaxID=2866212 RepID=A0ABS7GJY5_9BACT|nr:hypothetical protein [Chitinophaga rhizophila]MBW8688008.1 hypothetical protein [Chitinophaga rhizophila]
MKEMYNTLAQLGDFVNPGVVISGAIFTGIAAFFIPLIVLIILRKKILITRRYKALKFLAYSYFVLIPVLTGFLATKWGFFNSLRKDIKAHTAVYVERIPSPIDQQTSAAVSRYMRDHHIRLSTVTTDQVIDEVADVVYAHYDSLLARQQTLQASSNMVTSWALKLTKGKGVAQMIRHTIRKVLKEKLGLEEAVSNELMASRIEEVVKMGLFTKVALIQADHFLKGIQKGVLITWSILMLIPLAEVLTAHYLLKRSRNTPAAIAEQQQAIPQV